MFSIRCERARRYAGDWEGARAGLMPSGGGGSAFWASDWAAVGSDDMDVVETRWSRSCCTID